MLRKYLVATLNWWLPLPLFRDAWTFFLLFWFQLALGQWNFIIRFTFFNFGFFTHFVLFSFFAFTIITYSASTICSTAEASLCFPPKFSQLLNNVTYILITLSCKLEKYLTSNACYLFAHIGFHNDRFFAEYCCCTTKILRKDVKWNLTFQLATVLIKRYSILLIGFGNYDMKRKKLPVTLKLIVENNFFSRGNWLDHEETHS